MLTLNAIAKSYDTPAGALQVLGSVSLSLESGEAAVITGPSGSGKSTLLYIAGGLEAPSAGTVDLDGTNPYQLRPEDRWAVVAWVRTLQTAGRGSLADVPAAERASLEQGGPVTPAGHGAAPSGHGGMDPKPQGGH